MKIAFSTLGCPGWSWDEVFATAKDLGLNGIEIRGVGNEMYAPDVKELSPEGRDHTIGRLQHAGMEISMLTSGACVGLPENLERTIDEAKDYIDLASEIGVPFVRVMITPVPHPTEGVDLVKAKQVYTDICNYAQGKNVCVLIETNGPLANSETLKQFMEGMNPETAGVLWDIHHPYRYFGENPAFTYKNLKDWVRYLHVKDSAMVGEAVVYRMMGYGDVPVFDTLQILFDGGYAGYVSLEWVKRWCPELQEPGIVFSHYVSYIHYLLNQLK